MNQRCRQLIGPILEFLFCDFRRSQEQGGRGFQVPLFDEADNRIGVVDLPCSRAKPGLSSQRHIEHHCSKSWDSIEMRFEGLVEHHVPSLHSMPARIASLLVASREDKRRVWPVMDMAADERRADFLPYSHR